MTEARHVIVEGRVQGVGFRAWTRDTAQELTLKGWVRNREDGNVEAHIEGPEGQIDRMMRRLHDGPMAARVDRVQADPAEQIGAVDFEIRS
ncbi:acylphosphatase [Palleronia abyssalis]|uniref:Acylphosphatase n=1 Tax=Palleronia abyssalis TaxID=1501240 RepID=A0A2R8BXJ3_9RHOB|nr:acylphosphatase [Palleronia abyssalis]SPJ24881.1 Acylphosphatase [Palleronia abyssalis]